VIVSIQGKLISEITPADILDLVNQRVAEDARLEFKKAIFDPRKPKKILDQDREDWVADLVAFANSQGGHIIIGLEADRQERAYQLSPMVGDQAKKVADALSNLAIDWVRPHIGQLEIADFKITEEEWIVIVHVPESQDKPHMCNYGIKTRFTVRSGNRKREMTYEEIRSHFLSGPQEQRLVGLYSEIKSINSRLDDLERTLRKVE